MYSPTLRIRYSTKEGRIPVCYRILDNSNSHSFTYDNSFYIGSIIDYRVGRQFLYIQNFDLLILNMLVL
jgi:hypothetical protein